MLSEEGRDDLARLSADRVWIVDPLDGTREFGEPGRTDWAVHVALWERGELTAGAVALPAQGTVLSTAEPPPAPPARRPGRPVRVLVSRTRPPAFLERLAEQIELTLVPLGSAGAKAAAVIRGDADAYVHSGGQYEWDSAAPVAVARGRGAARVAARRLEAGLQPGGPFPAGYPYLPSWARRHAAGWSARGGLFCSAVGLPHGE